MLRLDLLENRDVSAVPMETERNFVPWKLIYGISLGAAHDIQDLP